MSTQSTPVSQVSASKANEHSLVLKLNLKSHKVTLGDVARPFIAQHPVKSTDGTYETYDSSAS